ncbi:TPA: triacylglycerol lipase, partial [Streptococcus suis]|nr:triacylglycerol lipase [Streptococcus suis]
MTQYNQYMIQGAPVWTQNGSFVGTVTLDFDNENGNGEQVYAVVKNPNLPKDQ